MSMRKLVIDRWQKRGFALTTVPLRLIRNRRYTLRLEFFENVGNVRCRLVWDDGIPPYEERIREALRVSASSDVTVVVAGVEEG